jgi:hypothetical protein
MFKVIAQYFIAMVKVSAKAVIIHYLIFMLGVLGFIGSAGFHALNLFG